MFLKRNLCYFAPDGAGDGGSRMFRPTTARTGMARLMRLKLKPNQCRIPLGRSLWKGSTTVLRVSITSMLLD
jgi:hypothetical protein